MQEYLNCGVVESIGFAVSVGGGLWTGMDVDLCRAVAGAALGDPNLVRIVPLTPAERFGSLQRGDIDVLAGRTTLTMERDVYEVCVCELVVVARWTATSGMHLVFLGTGCCCE